MSQTTVLTGILQTVVWGSSEPGNDYKICRLRTGETIKGSIPSNELITGLTYHFQGVWKDGREWQGRKQKEFCFSQFKKTEPVTKQGVTQYLEKFAPGIGPTIAGRLFDEFGETAVKVLRTDPELAAARIKALHPEAAKLASAELKKNAKFEEVRIDLAELLSGRGFSSKLPGMVVTKWGINAARKIRHDPFCLLIHSLPSAGFARCDRLYLDLGRPAWKLRRLMLCLWNQARNEQDGHTWHDGNLLMAKLVQSAVCTDESSSEMRRSPHQRLMRALQLGVKTGWLALRKDGTGKIWIAEGENARNEESISNDIKRLIQAGSVTPVIDHDEDDEDRESRFAALTYDRLAGESAFDDEFSDSQDGFQDATPEGSPDETSRKIALGKQTGICQFCRRPLMNEESKLRGYGPICAGRYGLPWGETSGVEDDPGVSRKFRNKGNQDANAESKTAAANAEIDLFADIPY